MKKVVTIGGGTGQYTLLRGLKNYDVNLSAVVSMFDNGGNTGKLRVEFGVLPTGDLRNCILALCDEIELKDIMKLFEFRFPKTNWVLSDYSLGNMILTALNEIEGDIAKGVKTCLNILGIKGQIFPVTLDNTHLFGETFNGKKLFGQSEVSYPEVNEKIKRVWLEPESYIYNKTADAIRDADLIVLCPGDLYGSLIPNFLVRGFKESLNESRAKIVCVTNLVTKQGNYGFKISDFVEEIEKYLGKKIDCVICNTKKPTQNIVDKYREENSHFVEPDINGERVIRDELLEEIFSGGKIVVRHNPEKTAKIIMGLL